MFLIEFESGVFIDGNKITYINIQNRDRIFFMLEGEDGQFIVDDHLVNKFLNHLQSLNNNITSIESWKEK